jgi:pimeloyl-ACP methyl ester carboxylesterase
VAPWDRFVRSPFLWHFALHAVAGLPEQLVAGRQERERGGDIADYVQGFRDAGVSQVHSGIVAGAGHFSPEENPAETWRLIAEFTL